jgi:cob(I)alamin adenosyltransferase
LTPFYTSKGDSGNTGYLGEGRISKTSIRIEAIGAVDEASAALGLARALTQSERTRTILLNIQKQLYLLMSELASAPDVAEKFDKISEQDVINLEAEISDLEATVELPREFIIPGENPASGALAIARTVVRRAERRTIALLEAQEIHKQILVAFLNRLSSLIFVLEVYESSISGHNLRLVKGQ